MSRLTDLLGELRKQDTQLAKDLEAEVVALAKQKSFGLVFERHQPEAVELPGLQPRVGSKVHILQPRGSTSPNPNALWTVEQIRGVAEEQTAILFRLEAEETEQTEVPLNDLVVVAEFSDRIYPGLVETGRVERGGNKPYNVVINSENYHALEMLTYTNRHSVDVIYIDPPYNTGAKDWKYNNDYVAADDAYRHSKWLAFMERRLLVAKELLNPEDSVLIVTIDEKEYLRLGLLLEQVFPEGSIQMVSSIINPGGSVRTGEFSRTDEYIYFVKFGVCKVLPLPLGEEWRGGKSKSTKPVTWRSLLRGGEQGGRADRPQMFFPVHVGVDDGRVVSIGEPLASELTVDSQPSPEGTYAVWPINRDGSEGRWRIGRDAAIRNAKDGFVRANVSKNGTTISYLAAGFASDVRNGKVPTSGRDARGVVVLGDIETSDYIPGTAWSLTAHNSRDHGSALVSAVTSGRSFPYPKSLYAVEDALRFFAADRPEAVVLDFFAGSGTTAHALMRLNKQDGGRRRSISVTNNEVSAEEQTKLRKDGLRPGDPEWEALGICDYITKPRITAAITGRTPDGNPISGDYKFTDEFPMADGFEENAAFFTLTYESSLAVRHNRAFEQIAPLLWLRAGASGEVICDLGDRGWQVGQDYAVLENFDNVADFLETVQTESLLRTVFLITDDDAAFQMASRGLPDGVAPVRLYSSYLENFEINRGRF